MKTALATAIALVATLAHAAPSPAPIEARQYPTALLTFQGAGPNPPSYTIAELANNSVFTIGASLNFSLPLEVYSSPRDPISVFTHHLVPIFKATEGNSNHPSTTDNPLSVSHIILGPGGYKLAGCALYGKDGSVTSLADASSADVGPPQPQVSGVCFNFQ